MLFSILPRRAYDIECNFSKEEFHKRLNDAFNTPDSQDGNFLPKNLLNQDFSISYYGNGNEFEVDKTVFGKNNQQNHFYATGTIDALNEKYLRIHVEYYIENNVLKWIIPLISLMNILVFMSFLRQMIHNGLASQNIGTLVSLAGIFAPWLFRYYYVRELEGLHKRILEALK